ncbi:type II secretion system F family protein [Vibrio navarrensis]
MSIYLYLLLIGAVAFFYSRQLKQQKTAPLKNDVLLDESDDLNLVNLSSLQGASFKDRSVIRLSGVVSQLGPRGMVVALTGILAMTLVMSYVVGISLLLGFWPVMMTVLATPLLSLLVLSRLLLRRRQKQFEASFPDAINLMTSAVGSGESVMQAIQFVGDKLDSVAGQEFKWVGQRLQIGESPDEVFRRTCQRCPYKSYRFFVVTLRANMLRGGQLKELMTRLNRVLFDARSIEKKTLAMTSEARLSAKIVAAIPFLFLLGMRYMSPENFDFVLHDPSGRMVLFYLIGSEFIGLGIIWWLIRGIR